VTGPRWLGLGRLAGTLAALAAGEAVLGHAGRSLPPLVTDGERLARTLQEGEPVLVAVSGLRLVALVVGAGLLAVTAAGIAARAVGAARLVARLDRWTPPSLRRILDGALGAGLAASIGMASLPAGADPSPPPPAMLRRLADAPLLPLDPAAATTTLRRLPDAPPARAGPPLGPAAPPAPASAGPVTAGPRPPRPEPPAGAHREVVVRPGDSFWRLAERHEAERLGRHPSDAEVAICWKQLVASNRHRLVVPDNPDLLFPGQVLHLPCP